MGWPLALFVVEKEGAIGPSKLPYLTFKDDPGCDS
jgi:hypothetical protein